MDDRVLKLFRDLKMYKKDIPELTFLVNASYSENLNPSKNIRFPGTQVVSLSRQDLENLKGFESKEKFVYREHHILPWICSQEIYIPRKFQYTILDDETECKDFPYNPVFSLPEYALHNIFDVVF